LLYGHRGLHPRSWKFWKCQLRQWLSASDRVKSANCWELWNNFVQVGLDFVVVAFFFYLLEPALTFPGPFQGHKIFTKNAVVCYIKILYFRCSLPFIKTEDFLRCNGCIRWIRLVVYIYICELFIVRHLQCLS